MASEEEVTTAPAMPVDEPPTAADLLIGLIDGTLSRVARRPIKVRTKVNPISMAFGTVDVLVFELGELELAGLEVERLVIHVEQVRITPGLPPHLKAGPIGFKASVAQDAIDRWTQRTHLPVRLLLTDDGIVVRTSVRGFALSEVTAEIAVSGHLLTLRPTRASFVGMPTPVMGFLRGFLPLPPLPRGARLTKVDHEEGRLTAWFELDDVDQPLSPAIARRLRPRLLPRLTF